MSDDKQPSAVVQSSPDGQHQSATLIYDREVKYPGIEGTFKHKEKVTIGRDGDNAFIYTESYGDDGKAHGFQPFVSARADGVVFTDSRTEEKFDTVRGLTGETQFSPQTQSTIKALADKLLKDGKFTSDEAKQAFDATLSAPQQVVAEHMNRGKGGRQ